MEGLTTILQSLSDSITPVVNFIIWIFPIKIYRIHDGELGVVKTFGRVRRKGAERKPGISICYCCEEIIVVQSAGKFIDLAEQALITKDNKVVVINAGIEYSITSMKHAVLQTEEIEKLIEGYAMNRIREHAKTKTYVEVMDSTELTDELSNRKIRVHGVRIDQFWITDLRPHNVTMICDTLKNMLVSYQKMR